MNQDEWITGKLVLRINGEPVEMQMTVPAAPIKPQRMLPIFQQMSSAVVATSVEANGKEVSCKAGCGACCRQAVPISEAEAYQIAELVEAMEPKRRSIIKERFSSQLAHFTKLKWFDRLIGLQDMAHEKDPNFSPAKYMAVVTDYFKEGLPCPFLEDESCSIHPDRPLVCREYLVTSPAENCSDPKPTNIEKVPIFMRPSKAMLKVGRSSNSEGMSSLMMIEALDFVERNPDRFPLRTGPEWAELFVKELASEDRKVDNSSRVRRKKPRHKK